MRNASEYELLKLWLWIARLRKNNSELQKKKNDSKHRNKYARRLRTPKLKEDRDTECQAGQWLWIPKWRYDSECQTEKDDDSKCQVVNDDCDR